MSGEHILIAEDDQAYLAALSFTLEAKGYRISKAVNGKIAFDKISRANENNSQFDLLITDLRMPDMDGLELIRHIRDSGFTLPVIVITGYGDKDTLKELIRLGCDEFMDKPFGPAKICRKVSEILTKQKLIKKTYDSDLLKKHRDLLRELESYKRSFQSLKKEVDTAAITYNDLVSIKADSYNIAIEYRIKPLHRMGGDYLDICNTPTGCDILVADVAGHDLAASYHTVMIKAFFDENCRTGKDGRSFFRILNHALLENGQNDRMVTAVFLRLDMETGRGEIISGGHPKIIRQSKQTPIPVALGATGSVLGLHKEVSFDKVEFDIIPGDRFFLFTDGVINVYYVDGPTGKRHILHEEGLQNLIDKYSSFPLESLVDKLWNKILRFCRYKPADDMLMFALEVPEG
ncbi:SpoIIE family protein phosphatase [Desulfococcaceae bacterium HSG8]|nr:SpoIIE family protein phosphatase [Desulfococcaceae bacterium HSG8]